MRRAGPFGARAGRVPVAESCRAREVGSLLAEYTGLGVQVFLAAALCLGIAWLSGRLAGRSGDSPRDPADDSTSASVPPEPNEEPVALGASLRFGPAVLLSLVFGAAALYVVIWGVVLREAGVPGLLVMVAFVLPLVSGLIYAWSKDLLG